MTPTPRQALIEIMGRAMVWNRTDLQSDVDRCWDLWTDEAESALDALISAGWLPVPLEPTEEMLTATFDDEYGAFDPVYRTEVDNDVVKRAWSQLLNASPLKNPEPSK